MRFLLSPVVDMLADASGSGYFIAIERSAYDDCLATAPTGAGAAALPEQGLAGLKALPSPLSCRMCQARRVERR